jgi:GntR family transcriptional regulator of arabinose operon
MKDRIDHGELTEGAQLPSEPELVGRFNLSRYQVRRALRELELAGYIERSRGRGTFVNKAGFDHAGITVPSSNSVVLSFPQYASRFARGIVEGFIGYVSETGFQSVAYNCQLDGDSEYKFLQSVRRSGAAGFAMWLGHVGDRARQLLEGVVQARFPVCLIDRYLPGLEIDVVASDNDDIGYRLAKALVEKGHERICFVGTTVPGLTTVDERLSGFQRALREAGMDCDDQPALYADHASDAFAHLLNERMARQARPTGFVCTNDHLARRLAGRLQSLGHSIGDSAAIATVYDDYPSEAEEVPMITVTQDAHAIGLRSAELLMARIEQPDRPVQQVFLKAGPVRS